MPRNIDIDKRHFRQVIDGKFRKELKKFISTGKFVGQRGKDGKFTIPFPRIDIPHLVYGDGDGGIGRGEGEPGDVIGKDDGGKGGPGQEAGEGMLISVDIEEIYQFLKNELKLPDMKPKTSQTFDDVKIKYNDISRTGPESLRHNRRTMLQALKRMAASGQLDKLHYIPGNADPVRLIVPVNSDRRYRQYKEVRVPSNKAVIMFGRDGSASMDQDRCDMVSDMCYWIDMWIRRFYEKTERCYFWHDTVAQEVDEEKFYKYRYGGGTTCSTCPKLMAKQLEARFPPTQWNVYCFYFTDGENWGDDNAVFVDTVRQAFPATVCNLFAVTQVMARGASNNLKEFADEHLGTMPNYRSADIDEEAGGETGARNEAIKKAIKTLLSEAKSG